MPHIGPSGSLPYRRGKCRGIRQEEALERLTLDGLTTAVKEAGHCTCESGLKYSSTAAERATSGPRIGRMDIAAIVKLLRC